MFQTHWNIKEPRIARFFLVVGLVLQSVAESGLAFFLGRGGFSQLAGEIGVSASEVVNVYAAFSSGLMALAIVTFVMFCLWLWRSVKNTSEAGASINYSPGWAIGWWFVPLANLWKPFDLMCELYSASRDPANWSANKRPAVVIIWWLTNIGAVAVALLLRFIDKQDSESATTLLLLMHLLGAMRLLLMLGLVLRINAFQKRFLARRGVELVF